MFKKTLSCAAALCMVSSMTAYIPAMAEDTDDLPYVEGKGYLVLEDSFTHTFDCTKEDSSARFTIAEGGTWDKLYKMGNIHVEAEITGVESDSLTDIDFGGQIWAMGSDTYGWYCPPGSAKNFGQYDEAGTLTIDVNANELNKNGDENLAKAELEFYCYPHDVVWPDTPDVYDTSTVSISFKVYASYDSSSEGESSGEEVSYDGPYAEEYYQASGEWETEISASQLKEAIDNECAMSSEGDGLYTIGFIIQTGHVRNAKFTLEAYSTKNNIYNGEGNKPVNHTYLWTVGNSWTNNAPADSEEHEVRYQFNEDGTPLIKTGAVDLDNWDSGPDKFNGQWAQFMMTDDDLDSITLKVKLIADEDSTWEYNPYQSVIDVPYRVFSIFAQPCSIYENVDKEYINSQIEAAYESQEPSDGENEEPSEDQDSGSDDSDVDAEEPSSEGETSSDSSSHSHTYTSVITKAATCTSTGIRTYTCECGDSYTEPIDKTAHQYTSKTVAPTLDAQGYTLHTCSVCGDSYKDNYKAKLVNISNLDIKADKTAFGYTGKAKVPTVTIKNGSYTLKQGTDYTLSYKNNKNIGTGTITVTGKGDYAGTKKLSFTIIPSNVSGFKAASTSVSAVKLSWNKVSGAAGYFVYQYNTTTKKWVRIAKTGNVNTYTVKSLKAGTTYKYAIKAYKTVSGKNYTSAKFPTVTTSTKPAKVSFKAAAASKAVKLSWSKVKGATNYIVYYRVKGTSSWKSVKVKNSVTAKTISGLVKGKTYQVTVKAVRTVNKVNYNGTYSVKTVKVK